MKLNPKEIYDQETSVLIYACTHEVVSTINHTTPLPCIQHITLVNSYWKALILSKSSSD